MKTNEDIEKAAIKFAKEQIGIIKVILPQTPEREIKNYTRILTQSFKAGVVWASDKIIKQDENETPK